MSLQYMQRLHALSQTSPGMASVSVSSRPISNNIVKDSTIKNQKANRNSCPATGPSAKDNTIKKTKSEQKQLPSKLVLTELPELQERPLALRAPIIPSNCPEGVS